MDSTHYIEAEQHLRTLHAMIAAGEGGSEKADELREEATEIWKKLSLVEQQRLQRLSAELVNTVNMKQKT